MEYAREIRKISPDIPPDLIVVDALMLGGLLLTQRKVSIGVSEHDIEPVHMNFYSLKLAPPSGGKGTTSRTMVKIAESMGVSRLMGNSESAIAACAEEGNARYGIYYVDEIRKVIDPGSVVARQVTDTFLGSFDSGRLDWCTNPGGKLNKVSVAPFYPSLLIDGQPSVLEESLGRSLVSAGFLARFLVSTAQSERTISRIGTPDVKSVMDAYSVYASAREGRVIVRPNHDPDCAASRYKKYMDESEDAAWGRLRNQYMPKIALLLEPSALETGVLSTGALDRASVICSHFMTNSIAVLGLIHDDRFEVRRMKALRFIAKNPGVIRRDIMRAIRCSLNEFQNDVAPTLVARGDIHFTIDGRYFVGEKGGS